MTKKIDKHGLKKAVASHGRTGASSLNGCPSLANADAVAPPTKPDVHQQETAQVSTVLPSPSIMSLRRNRLRVRIAGLSLKCTPM